MSSTVAPWQELYGVAMRTGVDISEDTTSESDAATIVSDGSVSDSGKTLFKTSETAIYGIPSSDWKKSGEKFGVPVTNQPVFAVGQEINEYNKAIGDSAPTGGTGYNFQRGTQSPTTTFEFDVDRYTLLPFLCGLFQQGQDIGSEASDSGSNKGYEYMFRFPTASDGPSPNYFLSLFKTFNFPNGELISDAICTSMRITGNENEPLKVSFDLLGHRFTNQNFSTWAGSAGTTDGITSDGTTVSVAFAEMDPLHWNDAVVVIGYMGSSSPYSSATAHYIVEASAFDLTVTANSVARQYNSRYASKYVNNGYTVEGSVTFPYRSTGIGNDYLKDILTASTTSVTPVPIDLFWYDDGSTNIGTPGDIVSTSDMSTLRDMDYSNSGASLFSRTTGDFRILVNGIVRDVPDSNDDESMLTLNFSGANIRSSNAVSTHAMEIAWFEAGDDFNYLGSRPS